MIERHRHFAFCDRRLHLFPEVGLFFVIPHGNDRLVWRRVSW